MPPIPVYLVSRYLPDLDRMSVQMGVQVEPGDEPVEAAKKYVRALIENHVATPPPGGLIVAVLRNMNEPWHYFQVNVETVVRAAVIPFEPPPGVHEQNEQNKTPRTRL